MAKCSQPGRTCPLDYYYAASTLAHLPEQQAKVLYLIGGLYGNPFALNKILQMAQAEQEPVTLAFNGDFNWFNYDKHSFHSVNQTVLMHDASLGNVEAELLASNHVAGCGCAYPESVDENTVERSNQIHAILKKPHISTPKFYSVYPVCLWRAVTSLATSVLLLCTVIVLHWLAGSFVNLHFDHKKTITGFSASLRMPRPIFLRARIHVYLHSKPCSVGSNTIAS